MKNIALFCTVALLATAGLSLTAAPLQRADVPANVEWVAHADFDALRPTILGQYLLAEMEKPEAQNKFAAFQAIFSFDPRKQLHGLTLYSTGSRPDDAVLLVYAEFDPARLETLAKAAKDHQSAVHNQHVIHSWEDEKKPARHGVKPHVFAAISGSRIVVFGQKQATVAHALDVLDHKAPSLSSTTNFSGLGAGGKSTFIEAACHQLDQQGSGPNAALFRLSKAMQLQVGESAGQTSARLVLEAKDEAIARNMASVAEGLISLLKLQQNKPEAVEFANNLSLTRNGAVVQIRLQMPAKDLVDGMKADAARKAAKAKSNP